MRWVVSLLLICAAILKAIQLVAEPAVVSSSPLGRFLAPTQIAAELGVGVLALSGIYWRQVRWLALVLFTGFALYSLVLATTGTASCGCFGRLEVHPWWTFSLDVAICGGLLLSMFVRKAEATTAVSASRCTAWLVPAFAVSTGGAVVLGWYMLPPQIDSFTAVGDLVVLEPEDWIGKPLPIADFIDADLSEGDWILLLHRHDCPKCQIAAPQYEDLAESRNVALIEMPPYGGERLDEGRALHARMPDDREWFVQTPVEIRIKDGVVGDASMELPAIAEATEL